MASRSKREPAAPASPTVPPSPLNAGPVVDLALTQLRSGKNPRRTFNQAGLEEMAQTMRARGVLQPLLVRPAPEPDRYEIVHGERRFRAAGLAGLETVPCRVAEISDGDVVRISMIENLQREDVHPLEEADYYREWQQREQCSVADMAAAVGKDEAVIHRRLKLTELIEPLAEKFRAGKIGLGHAQLVAPLQPTEQQKVMDEYLFDKRRGKDARPPGPGDLSEWIEHNILLELKRAPFDVKDAELVPAAGACGACPKRTGAQPALFPDVTARDICTDPSCFQGKIAAVVQREAAIAEAQGHKVIHITSHYDLTGPEKAMKPRPLTRQQYQRAERGDCETTARGVVVSTGYYDQEVKPGAVIKICTNVKCRKHVERAEGRTLSAADKKARAKDRAANLRRAREDLAAELATGAILARIEKGPRTPAILNQVLWVVTQVVSSLLLVEGEDAALARFNASPLRKGSPARSMAEAVKRTSKPEQLWVLLAQMALSELVANGMTVRGGSVRLDKLAKACGVNLAKIVAQVGEMPKPKCEHCGCTEQKACEGGCGWDAEFQGKGRWVCTTKACVRAAEKAEVAA